jgi:hypothetical protein
VRPNSDRLKRAMVAVFALVAAASQTGCFPLQQGPSLPGDFHGRVIDGDTGEPIEGVVVTVVWRGYGVPATAVRTEVHSVSETLTDADGRFRLKSEASFNWNSFKEIKKEPSVVIYKAGYGPPQFDPPVSRERWGFLWQPLLDGATVVLRKEEDRGTLYLRSALFLLLGNEVRPEDTPLLQAEVDRQSDLLGVPRYRNPRR